MKFIGFVMMCCVVVGCSAERFPILHPDKQKETAKDYPCGLNAYQYQVVISPEIRSDYDYVLHEQDGHHYKVKKICCPGSSSPVYKAGFYAGYCH